MLKRRAVPRGKTYQVLPCRAARRSEVSRLLAADTSIPRRLIIVSLSRDAKPIVFFIFSYKGIAEGAYRHAMPAKDAPIPRRLSSFHPEII